MSETPFIVVNLSIVLERRSRRQINGVIIVSFHDKNHNNDPHKEQKLNNNNIGEDISTQ